MVLEIFGPPDLSLVGYFKKTNDFIVYAISFRETMHDKWCLHKLCLHKKVWQTENGLEYIEMYCFECPL